MRNDKKTRLFSLMLTVLLIASFYTLTLKDVIDYPQQFKLFEGEKQALDIGFPLQISEGKSGEKLLQLQRYGDNLRRRVFLEPIGIGRTNINVKLLGVIPLRTMTVDVVPKIKLIPGGQSVGVRLNTKGVLVVGLEEIEGINGKRYNPGQDAGLCIGDSIIEINHERVRDAEHVTQIINKNKNNEILLRVRREQKEFNVKVTPVQCKDDGEYRVGLWVRDKTAGVGTLTFFHPESMKYGALGHAITDIDTGLLLTVNSGEVVKSKVASIEQGKRGKPGEIKGIFYDTSKPIGNLQKNTSFGIYGQAYDKLNNPVYPEPLEIAFQNQIHEGPATILTTIENNKIEEYEVYIQKVNRQKTPSTKSMIIKITDKRLLSKSGGIVQGMSGSPIIQDGKLIGAVTHVFVHDPTKGYGLFIEWMIQEAGLNIYNNRSQMAENQ
ncbi:MAG: SpoIVB peptidase [Bacillota bacterium]